MRDYWTKYLEADILEREKMVEPMYKTFKQLFESDLPDKSKKLMFESRMVGYFDDLISMIK